MLARRAKRALIPIENEWQFLEVNADVLEKVAPWPWEPSAEESCRAHRDRHQPACWMKL
jgi:hypothetical protein